jgi:hypothetical protein
MAAKSDARVFSVDTRFQKMARREGGIPRDKAIAQAQTGIKEAKSHFDGWLEGELKEFVRLMKKSRRRQGRQGLDQNRKLPQPSIARQRHHVGLRTARLYRRLAL